MSGWRKRQVREMAKEAGLRDCTCDGTKGCLEAFAELVRADEREGCAKVCEEYADDSRTGATCAKVIRARGQA